MTADRHVPPTAPVKRVGVGHSGCAYWIVDCPYCGREHVHGDGAGHVVADCGELDNPGYVLTCTEQTARAMSKPERVAYLKAKGWTRTDSAGSQAWRDPGETGSWTLAAATRHVLGVDLTPEARGVTSDVRPSR